MLKISNNCFFSSWKIINDTGENKDEQIEHFIRMRRMKPDVIITAENFRSQFEKFSVDPKTAMIYLKNIVSKNEIEEKITPVLQDKGVI